MKHFARWMSAGVLMALCSLAVAEPNTRPSVVTIRPDNVIVINGRPVFPIGFTPCPAPGAKAPDGRDGMAVIAEAGGLMMRTGPKESGRWDAATIQSEKKWEAAAARNGMFCMPWLQNLSHIPKADKKREAQLKRIIDIFKNNPGLGFWKGADEPQWGKKPVPQLQNVYNIIKQEDPNHPVWIVQAPRGTVEQLRAYLPTYDIGGTDIYPIGYPPGTHSLLSNKTISMVGDYTREMMQLHGGKKPFIMTLQIAWSGVAKPGKTLRFPTFFEERFMSYEAIIDGANGLIYFGGAVPGTLNKRDQALGWNWTFWDNVLHRIVLEIGDKSPLRPALVVPNSKLPVRCSDPGIEFCVRQAGGNLYLLACRRSGQTAQVKFTGLPVGLSMGDVMYEEPRTVRAKNGTLEDWYAPYEVHVYRFAQ